MRLQGARLDRTGRDWTGLDAVRWLRSSGFSVPFILVTGFLSEDLAAACIKEGANDYIMKDNLERLPIAIMRALEETEMLAEGTQIKSALVQAERDLSLSERLYASIVEGAPYGIFQADDSGRILVVNAALTKMLGYKSDAELLNLNIESDVCIAPKEYRAIFEKVDEQNRASHKEVQWRHSKGHSITVRLEGRRIEVKAGGSVVYEAFVEDITEQRILEQQFRQAQKMEAIGRLAAGVAHDFNNLLMIIRGCAELLEHHKDNPQKIGGYIKQINDATSIAASVVQQLMAFSRKQVTEKRSLDFNAILHDLRTLLPRLLGEDIQIVFTPGPLLELVSADRAQIEQIILNLAVNARDAMPSGGKLELATSNVCLKMPQIETGGVELPPGNYVLLSVADSGMGMDPEVQSHIFEPFFTTKEQGKGTGLGLATVYGIIKENQGFIALNTAPGKGATFKIYFPITTVANQVAPAAQIALAGPGGSETILLVEDEVALREITGEYLQSRGYHVLSANSGLDALEICRTYDAPIDILMTDVIMPGIQGPELVKSALDMRPGMRVIYVSGYTDRGLEIVTADSKAAFLHKPYSLADLSQQIRSAASSPTLP